MYLVKAEANKLAHLQTLHNYIGAKQVALSEVNLDGVTLIKDKILVDIGLSDNISVDKQLEIDSPQLGQKHAEIQHSSKAMWSLSFKTAALQNKQLFDIVATFSDNTSEVIGYTNLYKVTSAKDLKEDEIEKVARTYPKPLYYKPMNLALLFSGRSGSTFGLKWFFYQIDFLKAASFYDGEWLHTFKAKVFFKSRGYNNSLKYIGDANAVYLVRDPFVRAVSSYAHAINRSYENANLTEFLNRKVDSESTFTFREFVGYLNSLDIRKCNLHHALQLHPLIEYNIIEKTHIVHLENSYEELKKVEKQLGLKHAPLEEFRKSLHTRSKKDTDAQGNFADKRYKPKDAFPKHKNFYDDSLVEKVVKIYSLDFEAFGYPKTLDSIDGTQKYS